MNSGKTKSILEEHQKKAEKLHGPYLAWIILATSLLLTICAWYISSQYVQQRAQDKFQFKVQEVAKAIEDQMHVYEQVLRGGVAFFDSSNFVSREEWKIYVETLDLEKHWPGIQGLGYAVPVPKEKLKAHIESVRAEGFADFTVKPEGERDFYTSIIYLEPFDWRNRRAFGYDMWSNELRRDAMKKSMETGNPVASGLITLVQETEENIQKGFLLYVPVYKKGTHANTPGQKQNALKGWVYAAFRTNDLMKGILSARESRLDTSTEMEIYDGSLSSENLLYSSTGKSTLNDKGKHIYNKTITLNTHGRDRHIMVYENENFQATNANLPTYIATGGLIVDILLFYVIYSLTSVQRRAVKMAREISQTIEDKNFELKENQLNLERLNESLRGKESRIKAIIENTAEGIISIDHLGIIQSWNKTCEVLFGYTSREAVGMGLSLILNESDFKDYLSYSKEYIETRNKALIGYGREVECIRKNGRTFPAEFSVSLAEQGNKEVFIGCFKDISEKKRDEKRMIEAFNQIQKAQQEAELASKSKSEFLANMSHEIRTPMTAILGYIDLLKENEKLQETEALEQISVIEKNGQYLLNIINDILDLSKIEAGKLELEYGPVSIFEKVDNIKNLLQAKLVEKKLDFIVEYDFPLPAKVSMDQIRVRQILINLLGNAIKFTQQGQVKLKVSWLKESSLLQYEVQDTGIGMTQEQMQSVFASFEQADNSITRKFGGTGLGLAITKRLTEMMGGSISVESEYGKGTTFKVEIAAEQLGNEMLSKAPVLNSQKIVEVKNNNQLSGKVLLVDDNITNLTLISKILKKMNLEVECCMNGQEAVDMLLTKGLPFEAVLMDVQMPVMDGLTAAGILKQNNYDKPVIALTANTMNGDREKCLAAGYNEFASKPINRKELFAILNNYLSN